jgi:hypothetical protein
VANGGMPVSEIGLEKTGIRLLFKGKSQLAISVVT